MGLTVAASEADLCIAEGVVNAFGPTKWRSAVPHSVEACGLFSSFGRRSILSYMVHLIEGGKETGLVIYRVLLERTLDDSSFITTV